VDPGTSQSCGSEDLAGIAKLSVILIIMAEERLILDVNNANWLMGIFRVRLFPPSLLCKEWPFPRLAEGGE